MRSTCLEGHLTTIDVRFTSQSHACILTSTLWGFFFLSETPLTVIPFLLVDVSKTFIHEYEEGDLVGGILDFYTIQVAPRAKTLKIKRDLQSFNGQSVIILFHL